MKNNKPKYAVNVTVRWIQQTLIFVIYIVCTITFHKRCIQLQNNMRKCYSCIGIDKQNLQADTIISVNDKNTIQNCVTGKNILLLVLKDIMNPMNKLH